MKVIGIYSGKGGVGKSTVASLVALALSKTHKVCLVDLDINTPSIPVLFGQREALQNLTILSMGFKRTGLLDFSGAILRRVVKDLTDKAKKMESDVIVIDMPPGLDDTHFELVNLLRPSFFVLVIQPNKLSEEDAKRTSHLFTNLKIPIVGVIQNMSGEVFGEYKAGEVLGLKLLGSIPLDKKIATAGGAGKIDEIENPLTGISENLFTLAGEAEWKITSKTMFEGLTYAQLTSDKTIPDLDDDDEVRDAFKRRKRGAINPFSLKGLSELGFMGLQSWDDIREHLMDFYAATATSPSGGDQILQLNDAATIRDMVYHLDDSNTGLFMIVRPPNTSIRLFPGEIGTAHLYCEGHYYFDIPRVAYATDEGEVVLFPHEIKPVTIDSLNQYLEEGTMKLASHSKTPRYVPTRDNLKLVSNTFGKQVGLNGDWEPDYDRICGRVDRLPEDAQKWVKS